MKIIRMQQKYDTEANWLANDPILLEGEIAFTIPDVPVVGDNIPFKIGNGVSVWTVLPYFSADVLYSNPDPTTIDVGGILAGSYFVDQTMSEMWDALLYSNQYPNFLSFDNNDIDDVYEVGYTIPTGNKTFVWTTTNDILFEPNSVEISGPGFTTVTGLANDGNEVVNFTSTIQHIIPASSLWTIQAENSVTSDIFNRFKITNWRWRIYWGVNSNPVLTESELEALHSNQLRSDFVNTFSFNATGYKWFTYPTSFGVATSFKDEFTGLPVAMEQYSIQSMTNTYGITTDYYVHRTTNILGDSINIIIS